MLFHTWSDYNFTGYNMSYKIAGNIKCPQFYRDNLIDQCFVIWQRYLNVIIRITG